MSQLRIRNLFSSKAGGSHPKKSAAGAEDDFCKAAGLQKIGDFDPNDIFIAGYPKSGNTWMQHLIASAFFGLDLEFAPDALLQELVVDVHRVQFYKRFTTPTFFKTHDLPKPEHRRVIYLLRDGRDVMVSYYHHLQALNGEVDFLKMVETGEGLYPGKWQEHVSQWLKNPYGAKIMLLRYEDLQKDAVKELRRVCEFVGIQRDDAELDRAAKKSSFSNMQKREKQLGWANTQWPKEKMFVRRGKVGSHEDEMPAAVRASFLRDAGECLKQTGYLA